MLDTFYVSTGEQTKMFTLRHQYEQDVWVNMGEGNAYKETVIRDIYIQNLSIDQDKAVKSAASLGFVVSKPEFTLDEIKKLNDALSNESRLLAAEQLRITQKMKHDEQVDLIKNGMFPYGKNKEIPFDKLIETNGASYIEYWIKEGAFTDNGITSFMSKYLIRQYPKIARVALLADKGNCKYFGVVGVRQKAVKVTHVGGGGFEGYYGTTWIENFVTATGELLTYMGSASMDVEKGSEYVIDFGIKSQEIYNKKFQTKILRVKFK